MFLYYLYCNFIIVIIIIIIIIISICQCGQGCCPGGSNRLDIGLDHLWGLQLMRDIQGSLPVIIIIIISNYYDNYYYFYDTSQTVLWHHLALSSPGRSSRVQAAGLHEDSKAPGIFLLLLLYIINNNNFHNS